MLKQMTPNKPRDRYAVTLQRYDSEEMVGQYRALAERTRDKVVFETQLSHRQIIGLLLHALGQQSFIDESLRQLEVEGQTEILFSPTVPVDFVLEDLISHGFDRGAFEEVFSQVSINC